MKQKKFRLVSVEAGMVEDMAESNSVKRLVNRAIREAKAIVVVYDGNFTMFVLDNETDEVRFHIGIGNTQSI